MGNPPRHILPNHLYETTTRTLHGRFLLRPSHELNTIVRGVIARAARMYEMKVCYFVAMSNHLHMLLIPEDARQLALFMGFVDGNIAKEAGRLHGWKQCFWERRYKPIPFTHEEEAQVTGLRYLLAHGCKEGLVRKPEEWPGANGLTSLLSGKPVGGHWFDRTKEYYARRAGDEPQKWDFAEEETLELTPIPCWQHLSSHEIQAKARGLVQEIEKTTRDRIQATGRAPLGPERISKQHPHEQPASSKRSPAPIVHAASLDAWVEFKEAWLEFRYRYRLAARKFLREDPTATFPEGCFPPRGAFIPIVVQARAGPG